ncbi:MULTISPECIES: phosphoribosylanthranilate isomerase [Sulfurovum]|uniref:N-(5'-phosphoribosyl)anthranilate isomerase n=1 Tax=Sulfurovum xiamenensis TaxID=3019066 RepID=A0ABT7QRC0_9BACT|nr:MULTISPECIES: phosphoribosylanthranilate isomerase [Sulfurovum]EIF50607.1 phosphoribosylanthranilate isomerase [Sulfurovum sp. AR]MDM5263089.1 phosphoribosylanthranilate isomerase [Sulfurovum xiamenensis]
MRVKICGITNLKDALHAVECGADALGFVFYNKSPRYITPAAAKRIIDQLPPFVERVGLFVNEGVETIDTVCRYSDISRAQIHFDVDEESLAAIGLQTLPVVRAKGPEDLTKFQDRYRLVDAYSEVYGGAGERLNLEWFNGIDCSKIILAGGLTPENLEQVKQLGFYGVDVSSGVESIKGKKDPKKVQQFIANAKSL